MINIKEKLASCGKIFNTTKLIDHLIKDEDYFILEKDNKFLCAIDALKIIRKIKHRDLLELIVGIDDSKKFLNYLYNKIIHITPTTFILYTDEDIENWFDEDNIVQNILDSYPEYNFIFYKDMEFDYNQLNEKNQFEFISTAYDIEEARFFNHIMPHKHYPHLYSIIRYPKLIEVFDDNRKPLIPFILPLDSEKLEGQDYIKIKLNGMKPVKDQNYFVRNLGGSCEAALIKEINFDFFFDIEVTFNLFNVYEGNRIIKQDGIDYQGLFFYADKEQDDNTCPNTKIHFEDDGTIAEDYMASDIYTAIPIRYESIQALLNNQVNENNFMVNNILTGLGFQENFEFGNQNRIVHKFDKRIKHFDLGTYLIITTEENHYNYYIKHSIELAENPPIPVRIIALCDEDTHTAVLLMSNLAVKNKPGDYLDEISRNTLKIKATPEMINNYPYLLHEEDNIKFMNFYKFIEEAWAIKIVGKARHLIISSNLSDPDDLRTKQTFNHIKAGFLYATSIYTDSEELGKIIDTDITEYLEKPYGDSIYDYASSYYSEVTALLYNETYKDYIVERVDFAVVDLFYLLMIQFEDSAIENASTQISKFINYYQTNSGSIKKKRSRIQFAENTLDSIDKIYEEYSLTLDFWSVRSNYNTSNKVLKVMREHFNIDEDIERLERNTSAMRNIYSAKQTRSSRFSALLLSIVGVIFTLQNLSDLFSSIVENRSDDVSSIEKAIFTSLDALMMIRLFIGLVIIWFGFKLLINSMNNRKENHSYKKKK